MHLGMENQNSRTVHQPGDENRNECTVYPMEKQTSTSIKSIINFSRQDFDNALKEKLRHFDELNPGCCKSSTMDQPVDFGASAKIRSFIINN